MLSLRNITKDYKVADSTVQALKGVSINFRKNEFVSILGPSGCGKTTLLNIIGGLDRYTSGEMTINGVSTKKYRDSDWDVYRNHRVGFIFQSYNLIPHQTILGNVELALTIAGISKAERVARAKRALDRVGLQGQYKKRPNQLSGGQCQRVAIARALVNEPEILLADEPTGALDTTTSVQIMDLIKEIAQERLVIMVTHNPELAEKYSTRIVRLLDGELLSDSMPYSDSEEQAENKEGGIVKGGITEETISLKQESGKKKEKKKERAKMSLFTSFRLSAQNLLSKAKRTFMVAFAGAIGIIGVSMVLSMSFGVQTYINTMQNDMLSGNPITVQEQAFDLSALMKSTSLGDKKELIQEAGYVNVNSMIENLISKKTAAEGLMVSNNITQDYVDYVLALPEEDVASVYQNFGLDVSNNIYTDFNLSEGDAGKNISLSAIRTNYISILKETDFKDYATYVTTIVDNFQQCPTNNDYINTQYDIKAGRLANNFDEIVIVIDKESELADILLAQLGYYPQDQFLNLLYRGSKTTQPDLGALYDENLDRDRFKYEDLLGKEFTYYPNDTVYETASLKYNYDSSSFTESERTAGVKLKVVGIIQPKKEISYGSLSSGFYYTEEFAKRFIADNENSQIINHLKSKGGLFPYYEKISFPNPQNPAEMIETQVPRNITYSFDYTFEQTKGNFVTKTATGVVGNPSSLSALAGVFGSLMGGGSSDDDQADSSSVSREIYTLSLQQMGGVNLAQSLAIYPHSFETKERVLEYLNAWNSNDDITVGDKTLSKEDRDDIIYTDALSLVIDMLNQFINIITIVLVGFTALSLVVSSVMIGIITYVSVVERTKEIGVIRSLGGRKKDVSRLFTAETAIIGLASGLFGIGVTYGLSAIINLIVSSLTPISAIAILPWWQAAIMIGISMVLTLISGVFPARAAAKKDPVVALRTE